MPRYTYVALDARGQESTGLVEADSTNEVIGQLRRPAISRPAFTRKSQVGAIAVAKKTGRTAKAAARPRRASKKSRGIVLFGKKP